MCHRFVEIKMRWFVGLLMGLSFHSGIFTDAQIKDVTEDYDASIPEDGILRFSSPVPIQAGGVTVMVGAVSIDPQNIISAKLMENTTTNPSQYMITALFELLTLDLYCDGGEATGNNFDCGADISNVNYQVTFQKKEGEYKVVGGRGNITNSDFTINAFTATMPPTADDLNIALANELMPQVDPPSELVKTLEITIDSSFKGVLP